MAMAYTTARGKTKKQKESVRKDNKNNQANKLLSVIREAPKKKAYEQKEDFANKQRMGLGASEEKLQIKGTGKEKAVEALTISPEDAVLQALEKMKIYVPTNERCFSVKCHSNATGNFKHCGKCRIARYCSPDCQRADWSEIHKNACCKTESYISVGCSVAIRPTENFWSGYRSFYPKATPPSNELHGLVISLTPQKIELFDSNLIATGQFLKDVSNDDMIVTQWNLENERSFESQKKQRLSEIVEAEKKKIRRELEKKEDEEEKKRKRAEKMALLRSLLLEKKKQEFAAQQKAEVAVDWSLFTEELLDEELLELEEEEDNVEEEPSVNKNDSQ